jgi:uncharacterized protein
MVLLTGRGEEKGGGIAVADLYYRRLLWLLALGLIHAYLLLFHGEVLFYYAWLGLLLFPLRNARPLPLLVAGLLLLAASTLLAVHDYRQLVEKQEKVSLSQSLREKGRSLTKEQATDLAAWEAELHRARITPEQIQREVEQMRGNYLSAFRNNADKVKFMHTVMFHDVFFADFLAFILLGMAFFKWGVFQARLPGKAYWLMLLVGYGAGISVNLYETVLVEQGKFSLLAYAQSEQTYHLGRVFTTLGHIGLALLLVRWGRPAFLLGALAAVGRMALSNYLLHSIVALFFFTGAGLGLFGRLERYQLYYVVGCVWLFQLALSPVWLRYFYFGPLEWIWRSLTYRTVQPFRRKGTQVQERSEDVCSGPALETFRP